MWQRHSKLFLCHVSPAEVSEQPIVSLKFLPEDDQCNCNCSMTVSLDWVWLSEVRTIGCSACSLIAQYSSEDTDPSVLVDSGHFVVCPETHRYSFLRSTPIEGFIISDTECSSPAASLCLSYDSACFCFVKQFSINLGMMLQTWSIRSSVVPFSMIFPFTINFLNYPGCHMTEFVSWEGVCETFLITALFTFVKPTFMWMLLFLRKIMTVCLIKANSHNFS